MWRKTFLIVLVLHADAAWSEVDVNQADMVALDGIRGVGPSMSRKILLERSRGGFKDWADLIARVSGINDKMAAKLSAEGLVVDGKSFAVPSKFPQ
nr:helix-hairpin-helix domain-containing protein [uncultured Albidiferax sp.]